MGQRVLGTQPAKLLTLQVLRAVAANLVVLQHLNQFETKYAGGPIPFVQYGDIGVDLFFVISGFVMVAVAGRDVGTMQFLSRRATRIYPTWWLASLITLGIAAAFPGVVHGSFEQISMWKQISMWRSFLLVGDQRPPVIMSGWTLVHEMYFYVVFAAILALRAPPLAGVVIWSLIILGVAATWPQYVMTSPVLQVVTSPLTFEFIMGVVIGVLWLKGRTPYAYIVGIFWHHCSDGHHSHSLLPDRKYGIDHGEPKLSDLAHLSFWFAYGAHPLRIRGLRTKRIITTASFSRRDR